MKELKYLRPYAIEVGIAFIAGVVVGRYIGGYKSASKMDKEDIEEMIIDAVQPVKDKLAKKKFKMPGLRFENGQMVIEVKK